MLHNATWKVAAWILSLTRKLKRNNEVIMKLWTAPVRLSVHCAQDTCGWPASGVLNKLSVGHSRRRSFLMNCGSFGSIERKVNAHCKKCWLLCAAFWHLTAKARDPRCSLASAIHDARIMQSPAPEHRQAAKSIFSHSSASTWAVFDLWLMFYLFSPCSAVYSERHSCFPFPPARPLIYFLRASMYKKLKRKSDQGLFACAINFICFPYRALALCRCLAERTRGAKKTRPSFFSWYHKIRTKPSVMVFKHVMRSQHHTYAPHRRSVFSLAHFVSIAAHIDPNLPRKAKEEAAAAKMDDFMLKS